MGRAPNGDAYPLEAVVVFVDFAAAWSCPLLCPAMDECIAAMNLARPKGRSWAEALRIILAEAYEL